MEIIRESMRVGNLVDSFFNRKFRRNILLKRYCMLGMHTLFGVQNIELYNANPK